MKYAHILLITKACFPEKNICQSLSHSKRTIFFPLWPPAAFLLHLENGGMGEKHIENKGLMLKENRLQTLQPGKAVGEREKYIYTNRKMLVKVIVPRHRLNKRVRYHWKIIEHTQTLLSHEKGSAIINVDYRWNCWNTQTNFKEKYIGKPRVKTEYRKKSILEESEASCTHYYNIKHSTSSYEFNKNSYTKGLFISVPVSWFNRSGFQQKNITCLDFKKQKRGWQRSKNKK